MPAVLRPGAGSDMAGVQTRAVPVAGGWVVNGQKVWTTLAHRADFGILLARTDRERAEARRPVDVHRRSPLAGRRDPPDPPARRRHAFRRSVPHDVFVPADALLPPAGAGWRIASAMLHHQRVARARAGQRAGRTPRSHRSSLSRDSPPADCQVDPVVRDDLARLYIAEVCQSLLVDSIAGRRGHERAPIPGPIGSLGKLTNAFVARQFANWRGGSSA